MKFCNSLYIFAILVLFVCIFLTSCATLSLTERIDKIRENDQSRHKTYFLNAYLNNDTLIVSADKVDNKRGTLENVLFEFPQSGMKEYISLESNKYKGFDTIKNVFMRSYIYKNVWKNKNKPFLNIDYRKADSLWKHIPISNDSQFHNSIITFIKKDGSYSSCASKKVVDSILVKNEFKNGFISFISEGFGDTKYSGTINYFYKDNNNEIVCDIYKLLKINSRRINTYKFRKGCLSSLYVFTVIIDIATFPFQIIYYISEGGAPAPYGG